MPSFNFSWYFLWLFIFVALYIRQFLIVRLIQNCHYLNLIFQVNVDLFVNRLCALPFLDYLNTQLHVDLNVRFDCLN